MKEETPFCGGKEESWVSYQSLGRDCWRARWDSRVLLRDGGCLRRAFWDARNEDREVIGMRCNIEIGMGLGGLSWEYLDLVTWSRWKKFKRQLMRHCRTRAASLVRGSSPSLKLSTRNNSSVTCLYISLSVKPRRKMVQLQEVEDQAFTTPQPGPPLEDDDEYYTDTGNHSLVATSLQPIRD